MNVNRETLNAVQRDWPLRAVKELRRSVQVALAAFRWAAWYAAWLCLRAAERLAVRARQRCWGGLSAAHHVIRPFDTWGEESNFTAQRQYDCAAAWFERASTEERNRTGIRTSTSHVGLMRDVEGEMPVVSSLEVRRAFAE
jgi:hypothetical protein